MLRGIDVSEFQGEINWGNLKYKIDFAILRAGYGNNNLDKQFIRNITECNRLEIPCGVYWFSYAYTIDMAKNEAEDLLNLIKDYEVQYPVCFDFEYDSIKYANKNGIEIDRNLASNIADSFCSEIQKNNYYAMNYANEYFIENYFSNEILEKYDLWYAFYNNKCNRKAGIWQYSESGTLDSSSNNLDLDYSFNDYKEIIKKNNLKQNTKIVKINGRFIVESINGINIRSFPSTSSQIVGSYSKGESVIYDEIINNGQYMWISWIGQSGNRRYMAIKNLKNNEFYGNLIH